MLQYFTTKLIILPLALSWFTHQLLAMEEIREVNISTFLRQCGERLGISVKAQQRSATEQELYKNENWNNKLVEVWYNCNGNPKCQHVYDPNHILVNGTSFIPSIIKPGESKNIDGITVFRPNGGTRAVGIYNKELCFKEWSEAPGIEIATYQFAAAMYSNNVPLPKSEVILMNGIVFLVSEFIEGEPLETFLELMKNKPNKYVLDTLSFQKLAAFCMITNPEDCRLQNCLVRKISDGEKYEIILIDNERSLGRDFVEDSVKTRVHCVLFCFYDMLTNPTKNLKKALLLPEMKNNVRLQERLSRLLNEHNYQLALRDKLNDKDKTRVLLGLPLGEEFIENAAEKWSKITFGITSEGKNLANIFREVMPNLANIYLNNPIPNVLEQIKKVDAGRHGEKTPPSAYVELIKYYFSDKPPTPERLLILGTKIFFKHGWQFSPEIESVFMTLLRIKKGILSLNSFITLQNNNQIDSTFSNVTLNSQEETQNNFVFSQYIQYNQKNNIVSDIALNSQEKTQNKIFFSQYTPPVNTQIQKEKTLCQKIMNDKKEKYRNTLREKYIKKQCNKKRGFKL